MNDPIKKTTTSNDLISVLIVDGFSNHDWQKTTSSIQAILCSSGKFEVEVITCPIQVENEDLWARWQPDFSYYDVIIQTCNDLGKPELDWPDSAKISFERYVREGGGVYMYHSANNAFKDWVEYNEMIGLGWRKKEFGVALSVGESEEIIVIEKGAGEDTGHGSRIDALITSMGDHPIHDGLPKRWRAADIEVYGFARGPAKNLEVVSYATDPESKINFPMEWVVSYGEGRVYNSTYGHLWHGQEWPPGIRCVAFQELMVRALQWLSGHDVENEKPDNFPTEDEVSLMDAH